MADDSYVVVCRGDRYPGDKKAAPYVLATRQVFPSREAAERYRLTCARSRQALVIEGRFSQLRFEEVK